MAAARRASVQVLLIGESNKDLHQEPDGATRSVTEQCFAGQGDHVQVMSSKTLRC